MTALARNTATSVETMLGQLVEAAQETGELAQSLDARQAASFLYVALQGLTVRAQAGANRDELASVADFTLKALAATR